MLLWLWCRLAAAAPIQPLAWEPPYAAGAAQEIAKRQKNIYIYMAQVNLSMKEKQIHRHREQTCGCQGGWMDWEFDMSGCHIENG